MCIQYWILGYIGSNIDSSISDFNGIYIEKWANVTQMRFNNSKCKEEVQPGSVEDQVEWDPGQPDLLGSLLRNGSVCLKLKFVRCLQRSERDEAYSCISVQCLTSPLGCSIAAWGDGGVVYGNGHKGQKRGAGQWKTQSLLNLVLLLWNICGITASCVPEAAGPKVEKCHGRKLLSGQQEIQILGGTHPETLVELQKCFLLRLPISFCVTHLKIFMVWYISLWETFWSVPKRQANKHCNILIGF